MKITKIDIPESLINNGLDPVKMDRLGQVVLLAGKNGAGKTRLLNLITTTMNSMPKKNKLLHSKQQIESLNTQLKPQQQQLNHLLTMIENISDALDKKNIKSQIENIEKSIQRINHDLTKHNNILKWDLMETDTSYNNQTIIPFVPKSLDLKDCNNFNKSQINGFSSSLNSLGINSLTNGTFARIQTTQERWFNATHQDSNVSDEEKQNAIVDYENLKNLIMIFLDTELDRNIDGEPTLFGFTLGQSNLSDGQKILIQLCLAIHCQKKSLNDIILFLDEPENHLHPSIIIDTIERIKDKNPDGQIWISTHSIALLSYFDPSNIWFVDDNKVSYAGSIPEKVLDSLLGDEERISKLQDFISLPGIFALNRHAFESLFHPLAVTTNKNDPQGLQIRDEIKRHLADDKKIRILDYGAGKGRLLSNIIENNLDSGSKLSEWFDYVAFDKFKDDKNECIEIIKKDYKDYDKRYFNDFSKLYSIYDKETFDIVIMSNVLHEIDPSQWLKMFSNNGEITKLLNDNGILLLVEDQEMLIGEKAYQKGFIVLDTPELKELFQIKEKDKDFGYSDARGDGRLKAHRIPKDYLTRITADSRVKCLEDVHFKAKSKILLIRNEKIKYKNGKRHGFWIQQYANTGLVLDELSN